LSTAKTRQVMRLKELKLRSRVTSYGEFWYYLCLGSNRKLHEFWVSQHLRCLNQIHFGILEAHSQAGRLRDAPRI